MSSLTTQEAVELVIACVPCPTCKAAVGQRCLSTPSLKLAKRLGTQTHVSRQMDYRDWRRSNQALYKQKREEIASRRTKPLPPSLVSRLAGKS